MSMVQGRIRGSISGLGVARWFMVHGSKVHGGPLPARWRRDEGRGWYCLLMFCWC